MESLHHEAMHGRAGCIEAGRSLGLEGGNVTSRIPFRLEILVLSGIRSEATVVKMRTRL